MSFGHNHLQDDWEAADAAELAQRRERAEHDAGVWFDRATVGQLAAHRAAMAGVKHLPADKQEAARVEAQAIWHKTTTEARDLYETTVADILRDGESSVETDAAWDSLLDLRAASQAEAA